MENIVGQKIKGIRTMTRDEAIFEGWEPSAVVIELENGTRLYASVDDEGNGPGSIFGRDEKDRGFIVSVDVTTLPRGG